MKMPLTVHARPANPMNPRRRPKPSRIRRTRCLALECLEYRLPLAQDGPDLLPNLAVAEAEDAKSLQFTVSATQIDGSPLPLRGGVPTLRVGDQFLVQVRTKDLRSSPQGVAGAYMDLGYTDGLLRIDRRENQLISLAGLVTGGSFTLTVTNPLTTASRTTGNITFDAANAATTRANILAALLELDNVDAGDVTVDLPPISSSLFVARNFIVRFGGRFSNVDVPEMLPNGDNLLGGQSPPVTVSQFSGVDPSDAADFVRSLTFGEQGRFRDVITASDGEDGIPHVIDDVGASEFVRTLGQELRVFEFQATALHAGDLILITSPADILPAHNVLLHGQNSPIAEANVSYGSLSLTIQPRSEITLTPATVLERSSGATIGTLSVAEPDPGGSYTFTVDDPRFELAGDVLKLKSEQYALAIPSSTIHLEVIATDSQTPPQTSSQSIEISVTPNPRPWQNPDLSLDSSGDGVVVPLDALSIINLLNNPTLLQPNGRLPEARPAVSDLPFYDVNGDNFSTPQDALMIVNHINSNLGGEGEASSRESAVLLLPIPCPSAAADSVARFPGSSSGAKPGYDLQVPDHLSESFRSPALLEVMAGLDDEAESEVEAMPCFECDIVTLLDRETPLALDAYVDLLVETEHWD